MASLLPSFLKAAEVADALGVTPSWVYSQCRLYQRTGGREGIPCRKFGTATRIPADALAQWVESR